VARAAIAGTNGQNENDPTNAGNREATCGKPREMAERREPCGSAVQNANQAGAGGACNAVRGKPRGRAVQVAARQVRMRVAQRATWGLQNRRGR